MPIQMMAAPLPALIAGGKAATLGAVGSAAGFGAKKALEAATRKRKRKQGGGAMYRPQKRLDKIAEGASMFLLGPAPSFSTIG